MYRDWNCTPHAIKGKDNNIHLISFVKDYNFHHKASLYDLVPNEIILLNTKRFHPLIIGYIKEFEQNGQLIFLPLYLKELVLQFYPVFL